MILAEFFIPHGHCYLWKPGLVGLHIVSDALTALAYYSIPLTLSYLSLRDEMYPSTGFSCCLVPSSFPVARLTSWKFGRFGILTIGCRV
jgi:hypothetical protein